ncbi:MAG: glycosyltransferase [Lachnospiraceae bacterium]|nr:glycosyltransferase [Lachnospiraceae bacterium]
MKQTGKEKNFVSCVVYLHNDGAVVKDFMRSICNVMNANFEKFEIVCVNDGCTDDTVEQLNAFLEEGQQARSVSLINLSFYQGVETAMNAGSDLAVGDFLFEFDQCNMDFDEEMIMQVYRRALEGYDVVSASPKRGVALTSKVFYGLYNWSTGNRYKIRQERFRIVSRRAINRVNQMNIYVPYRKAMYMNCGLKTDTLIYDNKNTARRNRNREERGSRSGLAVDTLVIFTDVLEKFSMFVSAVLLGFLLLMFGWIVYSVFSEVRPVEGWLSLMALMSFGFFMLSVLMTLIFKYLSIILNMSFKRQRYVIEGVEKLTK